jgi:molecular chaperone HscA
MGSGVEAAVQVKPSYGLGDDEIARMLRDGFSSAEAAMHARALREARVEAERMDLATQAALVADGDLLTDDERAAVEALLQALRHVAQGEDSAAINRAVEALATGTETFAAARMNRGIRAALTGRGLDEI